MEDKILKANDCSCPSCGATMRYNPEKQKLYCDNCQSCKDIEFEALLMKHGWEEKDRLKNLKEFANATKALKCPNCGANVVLNKYEYSKECPYCGSNLVDRSAEDTNLAPDGILPFMFSDAVASQKYRDGIRKKWFVPNAFKKAPPTENIRGIYIPSFGYDADATTSYTGKLATDHTRRDSNGHTHTYTTYQNISGTHKSQQRDILVETSTKVNQDEFEKIKPYHMNKAVAFKQGFIMGYSVEAYENSLEECKKIADKIMDEIIRSQILSKYMYDRVVYFNMSTTQENKKYMYYLLPIYKCDYTYKNKRYTTIMNGQTGKVGGGYPKSPVKITFFVLFLLLVVSGLIYLFFRFGNDPDLMVKLLLGLI